MSQPFAPDDGLAQLPRPHRLASHPSTLAVFAAGLLITALLATTATLLYNRNESRLLDLRVRDAGAALSGGVPQIQMPLASAAELAQATNGDVAKFKFFIGADVGKSGPFASVSLWKLHNGVATPLAVVGAPAYLQRSPGQASAFLSRSTGSSVLRLTGVLTEPGQSQIRLGYAFAPRESSPYVVYGESALPGTRKIGPIARSSSFAGLDLALYLGDRQRTSDLLETNVSQLPIKGRSASTRVPFGDSDFLLVMTPTGSLGGTFFQSVAWIVAVLGLLLSLGAALLVERLKRRQEFAERLAFELDAAARQNRDLYDQQRNIAETLQHALLPDVLPAIPGFEVSARYIPGVAGMDIGGDWYDVITLDERHFLLVIGDVSGRGLRAATVMAALRFTIRAYAAQGDTPTEILAKLAHQHTLENDGHFATILCAAVDLEHGEVTLANAGHLNPVVIQNGHCDRVEAPVGPPIGVETDSGYGSVTISLPASATLLAFTDGLVERRGQLIDKGVQRLQDVASRADGSLTELLDAILVEFSSDASDDDTAILGVRWQN